MILRATPSAAGPFRLLGLPFKGARCLHFDILGEHFNTSGEPSGPILAPRGHFGGQWGQQDGFEMVLYRILIDFGVIVGPVYIYFWSSRT